MIAVDCIKRLRPDQWFWLHAKVSLFIWGLLFFFVAPPTSEDAVGYTLSLIVAIFIVIGSATSIFGLLRSGHVNPDKRRQGLMIELFGLIIAQAGPITYCVIILSQIPEDPANLSRSAAFSYAFAAFLVARTVLVYRALKFWSVNNGRP